VNTPRTDANESITCKEGDPCVAPDFARQLETELIAMTALADRLASGLDDLTVVIGLVPIKGNREALRTAFDRACQALAAYENHKNRCHDLLGQNSRTCPGSI